MAELGFGCMRLPLSEQGREGSIDEEQFADMIDLFLAGGFCYFDTARGYHEGASEGALRKLLIDRYPRDSFLLASKLPAYLACDAQRARDMFFISLEDTRVEYFDAFLLHNLGSSRTAVFDEYGIWSFLFEQKRAGLIDKLGFSFHGSAQELESILAAHPLVDFVQLQINYADWESNSIQSRKCYEIARAFGLPIVVMEPIKGGLLAEPPQEVGGLFATYEPHKSPAAWALEFAASLPGVEVVLSGMSNVEQMRENILIMQDAAPLTKEHLTVIETARKLLDEMSLIRCTSCGYCLGSCPQGVRIPAILRALNVFEVYDDLDRAKESYLWASGGKASRCIGCSACEAVCPQHIEIVAELARAATQIEGS